MKDMLNDFFKLFANSVTVIALMLASFLLFINLYHYKEVHATKNLVLNTNVKYKDLTEKVSEVKNKINSVEVDKLSGNTQNSANNIKVLFNTCLSTIENSALYKSADKESFTAKDVYDYDLELGNEVNLNCMFYLGYNTNTMLKTYGGEEQFKKTYDYLEEQRNYILDSNTYVRDRLLANSSYSYVTDNTRGAVFDEIGDNLNATLTNYDAVLDTVSNVADWYVSYYGGGVR